MGSRTLVAVAIMLGAGLMAGQSTTAPNPEAKLRFSFSKDTTFITEFKRADGTPDYVACLNEHQGRGLTRENNGFAGMVVAMGASGFFNARTTARALEMLGIENGGTENQWISWDDFRTEAGDAVSETSDSLKDAGKHTWREADHPILARYLKSRETQLTLIAEAVRKPRWWRPYVADSMVAVSLPALGPARQVGEVLCARATLRAQGGDFDGFLADTLSVKHLARKVGSGATMIEALVSHAIENDAEVAMGAVAGSGLLTGAQSEMLRSRLATLEPPPAVADKVNLAERFFVLDTLVRTSLSRGGRLWAAPGDPLQQLNTVEAAQVDFDVVLRLANRLFDDYVNACRQPTWALQKAGIEKVDQRLQAWNRQQQDHNRGMLWMDKDESQENYSARVGKALLAVITPSLSKALELEWQSRMRVRAGDAVRAAAGHRAKTGQWPSSLEDLVPGYLAEVPGDCFAEGRLKYRVSAGGVLVYSVGSNGKDDGGVFDRDRGCDDLAIGVMQSQPGNGAQ